MISDIGMFCTCSHFGQGGNKISKALEHSKVLRSFETRNGRKGESNLVPILWGNHSLERLTSDLYYFTRTEFFALSKFFVENLYCRSKKLERLQICVSPEYKKCDKEYLKFATIVAETNVARRLFLSKAGGCMDPQLVEYTKKVGGFDIEELI